MSFQPGQVVGEYTIVRALGSGGLGQVYEAQHLISQRAEAIKVLLPDQTATPEAQERFRREIQMLASLNHPNIAGLHNAFYFDQQLIMVMELVEGEDLRSFSRRTRIALPVLIEFAAQVLTALDYAHARGVIHRDIKPANIMVSTTGIAKVLDFGIAITDRATHLTAAGALIGSPTHMAPEQMRGEIATAQSDLYSLGVTLYELIAGQPPMQGATTYELMMAHLYIVPIPLHQLRPDIPQSLSDAISRALEKEPAKRFASANDFLAALRQQPGPASAPATPPLYASPGLANPNPLNPSPSQTRLSSQPQTQTPAASWQGISTDEQHRPPTGSLDPPLAEVIKHLAAFIGPIAKIVVTRIAKQHTDLDRIYEEASRQIDSDTDRQKFLRTRPR